MNKTTLLGLIETLFGFFIVGAIVLIVLGILVATKASSGVRLAFWIAIGVQVALALTHLVLLGLYWKLSFR